MSSHYHEYHESQGPQSYRVAGRTILCKGGGGGDGGAAKREAERQARIKSGTEAVNKIFGIGDDAAMAQRNALYDTTKNDVRSFYSGQLEEDKAKAQRELEFQKARQGIIGSSQSNDLDKEFQTRYDRGLLDVANRADSAATDFKTNDEQSRLNLISKIVAGMDQESAVQNALSTMETNQEQANSAYQSQRMANVFADMFNAYNQNQFNQGQQAAQQQANKTGNYYSAGNYSGTTSAA